MKTKICLLFLCVVAVALVWLASFHKTISTVAVSTTSANASQKLRPHSRMQHDVASPEKSKPDLATTPINVSGLRPMTQAEVASEVNGGAEIAGADSNTPAVIQLQPGPIIVAERILTREEADAEVNGGTASIVQPGETVPQIEVTAEEAEREVNGRTP
jgi:hypothetical protein